MRPRVLILGATGMVGGMMLRQFAKASDIITTVATREEGSPDNFGVETVYIDEKSFVHIGSDIKHGSYDYIINCIGHTKPVMDGLENDIGESVWANVILPMNLSKAIEGTRTLVFHISTDCVFSGATEDRKTEKSEATAKDLYGKFKFMGEWDSPGVVNFRCSLIGPEFREQSRFLLEWFRCQANNAQVKGFTNHTWNGITTYHLARIFLGLCRSGATPIYNTIHIVPHDVTTKCDLLHMIAADFDRKDINIESFECKDPAFMHLSTMRNDVNAYLWSLTECAIPPSIGQMVRELSEKKEEYDIR